MILRKRLIQTIGICLAALSLYLLAPPISTPSNTDSAQDRSIDNALREMNRSIMDLLREQPSVQEVEAWLIRERERLHEQAKDIGSQIDLLQLEQDEIQRLLEASDATHTALMQLLGSQPSSDEASVLSIEFMPTADIDAAFFTEWVYPIFERSCIDCHGPSQQLAMLRMDARNVLLEGGLGGPAIVPGDSEESLLVKRIAGDSHGTQMPMGDEPLSEAEIDRIREWIDQGAIWPDEVGVHVDRVDLHWAYIKPEIPEYPNVTNTQWVRNPIDRFILAKLDELGLQPSPEADRETLIRRLSLDLIGLPPTPAEVESFLEDESSNAYEKLVNRLLASPHFGERWATQWLDLARYADSHGFEKDGLRTMWPYREWVIHAFNRDAGFDRFTIEQLAGDLLPGSTLDQQIATGFHRNTMINLEGGVNQEEYRISAVLDRVDTTATVWLGTTLACAQCHNHKYDPITQKEYFEFVAFFNNTAPEIRQVQSFEAVHDSPTVQAPSPEQQRRMERLDRELEEARAQFYRNTPELSEDRIAWETKLREETVEWSVIHPTAAHSLHGAELVIESNGAIYAEGVAPATDVYRIEAEFDLKGVSAIRLEALPDERLPSNGPGRTGHGNFVLNELLVDAVTEDGEHSLDLHDALANFEASDYEVAKAIDGASNTGWAIHPQRGERFEAVFHLSDSWNTEGLARVRFELRQLHGDRHVLGKFRFSTTRQSPPVLVQPVPDSIFAIVMMDEDARNDEQVRELHEYHRTVTPLLASARERIEAIKAEWPREIAATMVMRELEEPRETHVFIGGNYMNLGERVEPGVPGILPPLPDNVQANRLALARWLVSRENPLTARVTVNRVWEQIFGYGIVKTTEDLGTRAPDPINQELLAWLAIQFMSEGWSFKSLLYHIATSSAYRQRSRVTPDRLELDPENRYLSRGPRFRLKAEFIRDQALQVSGLLNRAIGGPSVFPYQPDGIWQMPYSSDRWIMSEDGNQYRRGLYTHWQRTAPYPAFIVFDAPSREVTCPQRVRTNTPLQALATLNDPAFFEAAQTLADRMWHEVDSSPREQLIHGFRLTLTRAPQERELDRLIQLYREQLAHYRANPQEAKAAASPNGTEASLPERAALTIVANVLLNLDETLNKG